MASVNSGLAVCDQPLKVPATATERANGAQTRKVTPASNGVAPMKGLVEAGIDILLLKLTGCSGVRVPISVRRHPGSNWPSAFAQGSNLCSAEALRHFLVDRLKRAGRPKLPVVPARIPVKIMIVSQESEYGSNVRSWAREFTGILRRRKCRQERPPRTVARVGNYTVARILVDKSLSRSQRIPDAKGCFRQLSVNTWRLQVTFPVPFKIPRYS